MVEDSEASDHGTVKMPADGVWSTQMRLDLLPREGKWRLYAYVRVDPKSSGSVVFYYGVEPGGGPKAASFDEFRDGKYHLIEFPGNPWSFRQGTYLWFAGADAAYRLYIDRIVAVREGATDVEELSNTLFPADIQCYPNPFREQTVFEYTIPESSQVNISIYDVNGKKVRTLFRGTRTAGSYREIFRAEDLPPAFYYYRLEVAGEKKYFKTGMMIHLK